MCDAVALTTTWLLLCRGRLLVVHNWTSGGAQKTGDGDNESKVSLGCGIPAVETAVVFGADVVGFSEYSGEVG